MSFPTKGQFPQNWLLRLLTLLRLRVIIVLVVEVVRIAGNEKQAQEQSNSSGERARWASPDHLFDGFVAGGSFPHQVMRSNRGARVVPAGRCDPAGPI